MSDEAKAFIQESKLARSSGSIDGGSIGDGSDSGSIDGTGLRNGRSHI